MNAAGFLERSIMAALLIATISVIRIITKRYMHRKIFVILWGIVLLRLILPFSLTFNPPVSSGLEFTREITSYLSEQHNKLYTGKQDVTDAENISSAHIDASYSTHSSDDMDGLSAGTDRKSSTEVSGSYGVPLYSYSRMLLTGLWAAGAAIMFFILTASYLRSNRRIKEALPLNPDICNLYLGTRLTDWHKVRLLVSDQINTPVACGIWRPQIVFPKFMDMSDIQSVTYIIEHELCHLRRRDQIWKLAAAAALCLHWFNPFVWLMCYLIQQDLEISCDEEVIARLGDKAKEPYAMTLLRCAEKKSGLSILFSSFGKNIAQERIVTIMKYKKSNIFSIITAVVLIFGSLTVFASGTDMDDQASVFKECAVSLNLENVMLDQLLYYEPLGLTLDKDNKYLQYEGKPVRELYDENIGVYIAISNKEEMPEDNVDIRTVYDGDKLTGLRLATQEEYNARSESRDKHPKSTSVLFYLEMPELNRIICISSDSDFPYILARTKLPKEYIDNGFSLDPDSNAIYYKGNVVTFIQDSGYNYGTEKYLDDSTLRLKVIRDDSGSISEIKEIPPEEFKS
ncbi:MAG: M56 family metallopeptidase [Eubacteriales bacterium]|nr:M56 family metallopeptidase [Eubacteriales bacterium]